VYPVVIKSIEEAFEATLSKKILVAGGFVPGQSTTTVAMQIAESLNLDGIFVLTDVDAIYDKNPKKYPDAKKFDQIKVDVLEKILLDGTDDDQSAAGEYRIFDAVSIQIFKRSNIKVRLLNGNKLDEFKLALKEGIEKTKNGTLITH
jgi:uridylate kinase